jgi:hypothetical protein
MLGRRSEQVGSRRPQRPHQRVQVASPLLQRHPELSLPQGWKMWGRVRQQSVVEGAATELGWDAIEVTHGWMVLPGSWLRECPGTRVHRHAADCAVRAPRYSVCAPSPHAGNAFVSFLSFVESGVHLPCSAAHNHANGARQAAPPTVMQMEPARQEPSQPLMGTVAVPCPWLGPAAWMHAHQEHQLLLHPQRLGVRPPSQRPKHAARKSGLAYDVGVGWVGGTGVWSMAAWLVGQPPRPLSVPVEKASSHDRHDKERRG